MGLIFWKDNKEIDIFAKAIADDLFSYVHPDIARQFVLGVEKIPKKQRSRVEQKLSDIILQISRFSRECSLGVYGKARLQNKFNERLEELGYQHDLVKELEKTILLHNI